jgi:hypothetical protein
MKRDLLLEDEIQKLVIKYFNNTTIKIFQLDTIVSIYKNNDVSLEDIELMFKCVYDNLDFLLKKLSYGHTLLYLLGLHMDAILYRPEEKLSGSSYRTRVIKEYQKKIKNIYPHIIDDDEDYDHSQSSHTDKYGGYNGYDDETIDDVFEGDPSNTWNVD